MFTGLIEQMGTITALKESGDERRFRLRPEKGYTGLELGESIAVSGVCLTVEQFGPDWFEVYASGKTLSATNLGTLRQGDRVNLERAMSTGDRFGGHIVSGHVDCLAEVREIQPVGESRIFRLTFPREFSLLVVDKGSVALDGISLTVTSCMKDQLEVNIIPATWKETTVSRWKTGSRVNMETDIIGKYVQRMLSPWMEKNKGGETDPGRISMDFLKQHGF